MTAEIATGSAYFLFPFPDRSEPELRLAQPTFPVQKQKARFAARPSENFFFSYSLNLE